MFDGLPGLLLMCCTLRACHGYRLIVIVVIIDRSIAAMMLERFMRVLGQPARPEDEGCQQKKLEPEKFHVSRHWNL
jgi:hypothetical protein